MSSFFSSNTHSKYVLCRDDMIHAIKFLCYDDVMLWRPMNALEVCYPTRTRGSRNTVGFRVGFRVNV